MWQWILAITANPGLETFTLKAFSVQGHTVIPRNFLIDLADKHFATFQKLDVGMAMLNLGTIGEMGKICKELNFLSCSMASENIVRISVAYTSNPL